MKKILSVLVVAMLCVCMLAPSAFAALSTEEIEQLLADAEDFDIEALADDYATDTDSAAATSSTFDLSWLTGVLDMDTSAFTEMLSGFDASNLDSLLGVVAETMSGAGIDLSSFDLSALGEFDITSVLSSSAALSDGETQDLAATVTNMTAGLADALKSGLTSLGLDTETVEGLLDNEIVNFFANMYIGFIGEVEETTTEAEETTETTTKKPAVVTTETPKTGDTSAVVVAVATLALASSAALVCLKKKED